MEALHSIVLIILALSLLVFIHELGHFLPAKWFGMRVEKFFLFFDWPRKLFSVKRKGTEYGIGLLPFGGYVKIAGIIDESMDKSHVGQPPKPDEFRAKPLWQRMVVIVGGVTMNVLLAIAIYSAINYTVGKPRTEMASLQHGLYIPKGSLLEGLGLRTGDHITHLNGQPVQYLEEVLNPRFLVQNDVQLTLRRDGQPQRLNVPNDYVNRLADKEAQDIPLALPNAPTRILVPDSLPDAAGKLVPNRLPGKKAGLQNGDRILEVNGRAFASFYVMRDSLAALKTDSLHLVVLRGADTLRLSLAQDSSRKLGVVADLDFLRDTVQTYGLLEAVGQGSLDAFNGLYTSIQGLGKLFRGEAGLGLLQGPVGIAGAYKKQVDRAGALGFWFLTAVFSMWLAFVNILPIPALDGGHLLFLILEGVTGREPSVKVRMWAQQIGFYLLLALMAFVLLNDLL